MIPIWLNVLSIVALFAGPIALWGYFGRACVIAPVALGEPASPKGE